MSELKWLWTYLKEDKVKFYLSYFMTTVFSGLNILVPVIMGKITDQVIREGKVDILPRMLLILIVVTLARTSIAYVKTILSEILSQNTVYKIRRDIFKNLNQLDFNFYDTNRTGDIMSKMTGDIEAIRHFIIHVGPQGAKSLLMLVLSIATMFVMSWQFACIILVVAPAILFVGIKFANTVRPTFTKIREQFSKLNTVVQENISGNRVVKAFAKEDYEIFKFDKENETFKQRNLDSAAVWAKYLPMMDFLCNFMTFVLIGFGGLMVIKGHLTYGGIITCSSLIGRVTQPLRMAGWLINDSQNFVASSRKVRELMETAPRIKNNGINLKQDRFKGKVEFKDVSFNYGAEPVLDDINFVINPGETVAFVGATGSGKSTIMNLICRFYDCDEGLICIDRINVKNLNLSALRQNISLAMQDIFLFTDTIEGNIAYGVPEATVEDVKHVAQMASAHEFIQGMPDGYDTIVGERGVGLSGGQKQRIALARTLLKNPSVLILDDTTSSLDLETEYQIQQTLKKFGRNRTVLIVAHRISSVKEADKIYVLDQGRIVETGSHDELVSKNGVYADVYKNQLGDFDKKDINEKVVG